MTGGLRPCEGCGGWAAPGELTRWTSGRRGRRLLVRAAERLDATCERVSRNGLFAERRIEAASFLCSGCIIGARLGRGPEALSGPRRSGQMAAASAAILALVLASPFVEGVVLVLHRGIIEAPPMRILLDRTYKRFLDTDPTLPRPSADPFRLRLWD